MPQQCKQYVPRKQEISE